MFNFVNYLILMIAIIEFKNTDYSDLISAMEETGIEYVITNNEEMILQAEKVIIPNCDEFSSALKQLNRLNLFSHLRIIDKPILGISTGFIILTNFCTTSNVPCLGLIPSPIIGKKLNIGFHPITRISESRLLMDIEEDTKFYFSSDYFVPKMTNTTVVLEDEVEISAVIEKGNVFGIQFLPEKSGEAGLKVLKNFVNM